jgi:poly-gamma-glutamate synthesis protein (capsule biosynthesis protein)
MRLYCILALSCSLLVISPGQAEAKPVVPAKTVTVVVVGDVGLNRNQRLVEANGILEGKSVLPWAELTAGIATLIDGNFNFMNMETVVTDRNDLPVADKRQKGPFYFRSHPLGIAHLLDLGFNLISAANNHTYDYREAGARETMSHMNRLMASRPGTYTTGLGLNSDEAVAPALAPFRGMTVAFSSIGIITNLIKEFRAGPNKPGTMSYRHKEDWQRSVGELVGAKADIKIMSVHYGIEKEIRTDAKQRNDWRWAVDQGSDMVVGHHAHVVRGIELHKGKPIFYGLGNFLIRGAANIAKKPENRLCCDYGLLAKVHYQRKASDYELAAIEVVPLTDMHRITRRLDPASAGQRVEALNVLAEALDEPSIESKGVRFQVRKDGSGLYCSPEANRGPEDICQDYQGPTKASAEVRQRVRSAPDPRKAKLKAKANAKAKARKQRQARRKRAKRLQKRKGTK